MSPRLLALLLCLLSGMPALGASGLEAVRGRAQAARMEVRSLRGQQQALRDELNGLAARIESLKTERQGRLTAGTELEAALRKEALFDFTQPWHAFFLGQALWAQGRQAEAEGTWWTLFTHYDEAAWAKMSATEKAAIPYAGTPYFEYAVTWRASSRVWFAAYSWAPGSRMIWHRLADSDIAPCSPCRMLDMMKRVFWFASRIFWPSSSRSATAECSSGANSRGMIVSCARSKGWSKST